MTIKTSRRSFLRTASIAAGAIPLANSTAALAQSGGKSGDQVAAAAQPYELFKVSELDHDREALDQKPAENYIYDPKSIPVQIILATEKQKSATEFEWHEGRDHVLQILEGSTRYEIGGTPTGTRQMGAGEWHSTGSQGSKSLLLSKGDLLVIPRGTPHKRITQDSVTYFLISNPAPANV